MGKIAAIIPSAGYSSRMGAFKPLLLINSVLVIEKAINSLLEAGINDIRVIVGYKAELLKPILNKLGVKIIENPDYDKGMYSSIQAGVQTLETDIEAFFLFPVDYALVNVNTILELKKEFDKTHGEITYPLYNGRRGHPPLISAKLVECILISEAKDGLRGILRENVKHFIEIPVDDPGILIDLDTDADYRAAIGDDLAKFPLNEECIEILEKYNTDNKVILHVKEVARVAIIISEQLNSQGLRLHLGLVNSSALLHDIAKGEKDHPKKGQEIVDALGYPEVAEIIGLHMDISKDYLNVINEASIVYLSDKMVQGDKLVSMESRLKQMLLKYKDEPDLKQAICSRLENAIQIKGNVESILKISLDEIIMPESKNGKDV